MAVVRAAINEIDVVNSHTDASGNLTIPIHGALLIPNDLSAPVDATISIATTDTAAQIDHKIVLAAQAAATLQGHTLAATDVKIMFVFRPGN